MDHKILFIALLFFCSMAGAQQDIEGRVTNLLKMATTAPTQEEGAKAVDNYLNSLPESDRFELEAATWRRLHKTGAIDRTSFIQNMLELNERFAPTDYITLDYWRYTKMLDAKVKKGTLPEEEYRYLAGKKMDEANAAQAQARAADQAQIQSYNPPPQPDNTGIVLQSIGQALRQRAQQLQNNSLGGRSTNCTTRNIGGTVYTDCR